MSFPLHRGPSVGDEPQSSTIRQVTYCPRCKTVVRIHANQLAAICPNPTCCERFKIEAPTFQRGA